MTSTRISVTRALAPPAQHRLQPCRQRPGPERLRQKVVRAQLEDPHLVVLVALRGEHDDRDVGGRAPRRRCSRRARAGLSPPCASCPRRPRAAPCAPATRAAPTLAVALAPPAARSAPSSPRGRRCPPAR